MVKGYLQYTKVIFCKETIWILMNTHSIRTLTITDIKGNSQKWFMPYWLIGFCYIYAQAMQKREQPIRMELFKEYIDKHLDRKMFPLTLRLMPRPSDLIKSEHRYYLTYNYRHLELIFTKSLGKITVCNS